MSLQDAERSPDYDCDRYEYEAECVKCDIGYVYYADKKGVSPANADVLCARCNGTVPTCLKCEAPMLDHVEGDMCVCERCFEDAVDGDD